MDIHWEHLTLNQHLAELFFWYLATVLPLGLQICALCCNWQWQWHLSNILHQVSCFFLKFATYWLYATLPVYPYYAAYALDSVHITDRQTDYCFYCTTLNFVRKNVDNCNAIFVSQQMERDSPQGDWRVHESHFNACSTFLIIYTGNGKKLAIFSPEIDKNRHCALIGACWGESPSRHMIDFDQWEHARI